MGINSECVLLMLVVGYVLFSERVTAAQLVGVVLCVAGVALATRP